MSIIRRASAFTTLLLGALLLIVAYANLYNVDEQPRSLLAVYALVGVLLLAVGLTLLLRGRRRSKSVPPAL
jgi:hypothetical protein